MTIGERIAEFIRDKLWRPPQLLLRRCQQCWFGDPSAMPSNVHRDVTFYVDRATGDDANSGLSPSEPFATLEHALSVKGPMDLIYMRTSVKYDSWRYSIGGNKR